MMTTPMPANRASMPGALSEGRWFFGDGVVSVGIAASNASCLNAQDFRFVSPISTCLLVRAFDPRIGELVVQDRALVFRLFTCSLVLICIATGVHYQQGQQAVRTGRRRRVE